MLPLGRNGRGCTGNSRAGLGGAGLGRAGRESGPGASSGQVPKLRLAALSTLGTLRAAPALGPVGPEGVPVPAASTLAGTTTSVTGQPVDGIGCQSAEQTLFHIHAHLAIFVNGSARQIPAAIGIPGAQAQATPQGPFIASGTCFYWLEVGTPLIAPQPISFPSGL